MRSAGNGAAARGHLAGAADDQPLERGGQAGCGVVVHPRDVLARGEIGEQLHVLAGELLRRPPERVQHGGAGPQDRPVLIDDHDGHRHSVEDAGGFVGAPLQFARQRALGGRVLHVHQQAVGVARQGTARRGHADLAPPSGPALRAHVQVLVFRRRSTGETRAQIRRGVGALFRGQVLGGGGAGQRFRAAARERANGGVGPDGAQRVVDQYEAVRQGVHHRLQLLVAGAGRVARQRERGHVAADRANAGDGARGVSERREPGAHERAIEQPVLHLGGFACARLPVSVDPAGVDDGEISEPPAEQHAGRDVEHALERALRVRDRPLDVELAEQRVGNIQCKAQALIVARNGRRMPLWGSVHGREPIPHVSCRARAVHVPYTHLPVIIGDRPVRSGQGKP